MAPGNTLRAFDLALGAGADGIELDLRRTEDGHWVAYHDKTFVVEGRRRPLARTASQRLGPDVASLERILQWMADHPAVLVNVEIKDRGNEEELVAPFRPYRDRVFFTSFVPDAVWALKRAEPEFLTGLLGSHSGPFNVEIARLAGCGVLVWRDEYVDRALVERALPHGIRTFVWDVESGRRVQELVDWGVRGIVTDRVPLPMRRGRKR